jgi:hypothetical protein|tara:strand:- start:7088 stop:7201 length:114 start_codon:yes stop_codon:yes gene_type:complete
MNKNENKLVAVLAAADLVFGETGMVMAEPHNNFEHRI